MEDGKPFELVCYVTGEPRPDISWFLEEEEVKAEADISITYEGASFTSQYEGVKAVGLRPMAIEIWRDLKKDKLNFSGNVLNNKFVFALSNRHPGNYLYSIMS